MDEKYERRRSIIEHLSPQIYLFDERALKEHPNWRDNEKDADYLYWIAKSILKSGFDFTVENVSMGGMAGSQVITEGIIQRRGKKNIDYHVVLEKAVQNAYERQQKEIPCREEQERIVKQWADEPDNPEYTRQFDELRDKLMNLNEDLIRDRLRRKLDNYLGSRSARL